MVLCVFVEAWLGKLFPLIRIWDEKHELSLASDFEHNTAESLYIANVTVFA